GGGLVEAMPAIFIKETRKYVSHNVLNAYDGTYEILAASLGDDSSVIGAAAWAKQSIESNNLKT
ncbi:MAG: ROK family protein, partial [Planctomycetota bacterium]|nr:ROK family protein [Planctomycetota bacterium]